MSLDNPLETVLIFERLDLEPSVYQDRTLQAGQKVPKLTDF